MARDRVKRNVVELCSVPRGQGGRPSSSLTLGQAKALLAAATETPMHAYITVSLLTGARTEELRALTWGHVDLEGDEAAVPPRPPSMQVWRSVRQGGEPRPVPLVAPWRCQPPACSPWSSFKVDNDKRLQSQGQLAIPKGWSSPRRAEDHPTPPTSDGASAPWWPRRTWTPRRGHRVNYATASCRYCPPTGCPSSKSPNCSATVGVK